MRREKDAYYMICSCGALWEGNNKGVRVEGGDCVACEACEVRCRVSPVFVDMLLNLHGVENGHHADVAGRQRGRHKFDANGL